MKNYQTDPTQRRPQRCLRPPHNEAHEQDGSKTFRRFRRPASGQPRSFRWRSTPREATATVRWLARRRISRYDLPRLRLGRRQLARPRRHGELIRQLRRLGLRHGKRTVVRSAATTEPVRAGGEGVRRVHLKLSRRLGQVPAVRRLVDELQAKRIVAIDQVK